MDLSYEQQLQFARAIVPLIERATDIDDLVNLYRLTELIKSLVKSDDNGVAYDLGEFAYESLRVAKGETDSGWRDHALESLKNQLKG